MGKSYRDIRKHRPKKVAERPNIPSNAGRFRDIDDPDSEKKEPRRTEVESIQLFEQMAATHSIMYNDRLDNTLDEMNTTNFVDLDLENLGASILRIPLSQRLLDAKKLLEMPPKNSVVKSSDKAEVIPTATTKETATTKDEDEELDELLNM